MIKCLRDQRLSPCHSANAYGDHQPFDSLLTSTCHAAWKKAEVIPILKEGDHEVAFNNRPLYLLAVASKISEKIGLNQFVSYFTHINNNNRLSSHKSGSRKFHSTETLNIHTTDAIKTTALESFRLDQSSQITSQIVTNRRDSFHSKRHVLKPRRWTLDDRRWTIDDGRYHFYRHFLRGS